MPCRRLPETTFREAAELPPMVLSCEEPLTRMPTKPFGTAAVPAALRPMMLPATTFVLAASTSTPFCVFPEMTLPVPAPPTEQFDVEPATYTPLSAFGTALV